MSGLSGTVVLFLRSLVDFATVAYKNKMKLITGGAAFVGVTSREGNLYLCATIIIVASLLTKNDSE